MRARFWFEDLLTEAHPRKLNALLKKCAVKVEGGCWVKRADARRDRYSVFYVAGRGWTAHRLAHSLWVGPVGRRRHVHHKCGTRACFNPKHLELLTPSEHAMRHRKPSPWEKPE